MTKNPLHPYIINFSTIYIKHPTSEELSVLFRFISKCILRLMTKVSKQRGTTIVLFGITGDLAQKKLLPAMYDLYVTGRLKETRVVGFSRRDISQEEIRDFVKKTISIENFDDSFLDLVTYVQGQFDDSDSYLKLSKHLTEVTDKELGDCSNKLFYLSVPPNLYEMIATHISKSGLSIPCGGEDGFARVLIEKPFGKDLKTAEQLDVLLGELFHESQIYRIDHYVAKESLFKIIDVHRRDPNVLKIWDKEHIEKVEIDLFEKSTVGSRGASYDGVGAFRDVGQNHMLQVLALVAMDIPEDFKPELIQQARAKVLESLVPATKEDLESMKRGQYEGYLGEPGVSKYSTTETFFSLVVKVGTGSLEGVPFVLKSGKGLNKNLTQIIITFKDGTKKVIDVPSVDSLSAYQKILLDCISGDQTVFISTREIMAEWAFVTPIVNQTEKNKPFTYKVGDDIK
jgi:glucose-6-phosphate 1-dehydrogenase